MSNGDGTFGTPSTHYVGPLAYSVAVGDFRTELSAEIYATAPNSRSRPILPRPRPKTGAPLLAEGAPSLLRLEAQAHEVVAPVVVDRARPEAIGIVLDDLLVRQIHSIGR